MAAGDTIDVRGALKEAARLLTASGINDPGLDARRLLAAALQCTALDLITDPGRVVHANERQTFQAMTGRRARGEPLARILGIRDFYGRTFRLTAATLEPRPDSECLIDTALDLVRRAPVTNRPLRILDIGTGSGCLLLTLLAELPGAEGIGTDISQMALDAAALNAQTLGLAERVTWIHGSCRAGAEGPFDLIVSNPPYIRSADIATLDHEVRAFDPVTALDGGPDGLAVYRAILDDIHQYIQGEISRCHVVLEIGFDQADEVTELIKTKVLRSHSFSIVHDMAGRPRCVALSTQTSALDEKYLGI
jgi:release factor glutamine methyltransferase